MAAKKIAVVSNRCVACGSCVKVCPIGAISMHKGITAVISPRCVGCGKCAVACPAGVICITAAPTA